MSLTKLGSELFREKRWSVLGYLSSGALAYLSPGILFAFSAYLLAKSALKPGILTLGVAIGSVRFFAVARGASLYGERLVGHSLVLEYAARVRVELFRALANVVPHRLFPGVFAELTASLNGDVEETQAFLLRVLEPLVASGVSLVVAIAVATSFSVSFGVVTALGAVVMAVSIPLLGYVIATRSSTSNQSVRASAYRSASSVSDTFSERRLLGSDDFLLDRLRADTRRFAQTQVSIGMFSGVVALIEAVALVLTVSATLYLGVKEVASHRLGSVYVAVVPFLLLGVFEGLLTVAVELSKVATFKVSKDRLNSMLSFKKRSLDRNPSELPGHGPVEITLTDVTFSYPSSEKPVLKGVSFIVPRGEHLLVTGPSGSGKSTLASLIMGGWLPNRGEITIDGVPTSELSEEEIARHISYLGPEPYVFEASIEANLRIASPKATDAELMEVIDQVGLLSWYLSRGGSLGSKISMRQNSLSSGEMQRLSIARVLLRGAKTVLLDEPTANLDGENEKIIVGLINDLFLGATMVAISHSEIFRSMFLCDRYVELSDGRILG